MSDPVAGSNHDLAHVTHWFYAARRHRGRLQRMIAKRPARTSTNRNRFAAAIACAVAMAVVTGPAASQELRGHGGPVRAIAVSPDGLSAMTGSFDQSAILWQLSTGAAQAVLRFHDGAVNAVIALPDGRFATGGADGRVALWGGTGAKPAQVFEGHKAPVSALAISRDAQSLASASWDETLRVISLKTGAFRVLEGHKGAVNGVAFTQSGGLASSGYDGTIRLWSDEGAAQTIQLEMPQNGIAATGDGELAVAGADGRVRILGRDGQISATIEIGPTPLIALAQSVDGRQLAAGGLRGQVAIIDRLERKVLANLSGPGLPVWSLAFTPDGRELLSGGADRLVRRWNARTGEHIGTIVPQAGADALAGLGSERGAQVFRACAACHTLTPNDGNRAGPTLHGLFGRRIATAAGYNFSAPLKTMDIIWTKETVARLFEIGPNAYTPGTKMPEQTIPAAEDRQALVDWLEKVTATR